MLKQSMIYLVLSILVVVFARYFHLLIVYIGMGYIYLQVKLMPLFNSLSFSVLIRNVISLTLLPLLVIAIPALAYRAIKGQTMPYLIESAWVVWLIVVLSKILVR